MKKVSLFFSIILVLVFAIFIMNRKEMDKAKEDQALINDIKIEQNEGNLDEISKIIVFSEPIEKASERVTKKNFGIYVTPKNSPVQPEKFQGYHTGVDFEIFPGEEESDVFVKVICTGRLLSKRFASGYGGVATQECQLEDAPVVVVYGHLNLESIKHDSGDRLNAGDDLAILGKGYSAQTDGERKHLHLAIHKGNAINILGYVKNREQLSSWIDPCQYFCEK
ncbi:MAG: hypothetical protein US63_C0012G0025 [Candidatus Moranbacteria bacterium GW2011_GWC2_37_8]|nr:MAG: hypothetical protein US63_C0012G0025 [Candidatus Moranbacteria bacterium GW2011_GWC2_37_8]KKQ62848.1 MAG: hypothetical protein US82_C0005G0021 [Parcubacteria group bacterium GW2011_GWC1_38_22]KKQ81105.1 MAG: hypothetical protein UT03_C0012G0007 [Candidatus Moranbacteria bacterium GW2011_GWD2_38_7]